MIQVAVTILLLVVLTLCIRKGYNVITLLFSLSVLSLLLYVVFTGEAVIENSTGFLCFDVFELIVETLKSRFASLLIITMCVIGYTSYMNCIGASRAFTDIITRPFYKIKNKYILLSITVLLVFLMIFAVPSPSSVVMLLFATFVPIMIQVGVSVESIVSALIVSTCIVSGPSNPNTLITCEELGILNDMDISVFAFSKQIIVSVIVTIFLMIIVPIVNRYYDKKETLTDNIDFLNRDKDESQTVSSNKFYAFFPILPLILVIVFSKLVIKTIVISVVGAHFLSFFIVMILHKLFSQQSIKTVFDETKQFYAGMGGYIGGLGMVPVAGALFASALSRIGGLKIIVDGLGRMGMGFTGMMIFSGILLVFCSFVTADAMGSLTIVLPVIITIVGQTGGSSIAAAVIVIQAACMGSALSLVYPTTLMLSSLTNINITSLVKRNIIPALGSVLIVIFSSLLIF